MRGSGQSSRDTGRQESCSRYSHHVDASRGARTSSHVRDVLAKRPAVRLAVDVAPSAKVDWPVVSADPSLAVVPVSGVWPLVAVPVLLTCSPASVSSPAPVVP